MKSDKEGPFFIEVIIFIIILFFVSAMASGQEREVPKQGRKITKAELDANGRKYTRETNKARKNLGLPPRRPRDVGFRPVITWLPQGASLNVGPVIVSEDRRYVRMTLNPFFSQITGFKTFSFRK